MKKLLEAAARPENDVVRWSTVSPHRGRTRWCSGSVLKLVLEDEGVEAVPFSGWDDDERVRWWPAMVNK
jgi:hypothetical protein